MKPLYKQPVVEAVILASGILCTVVLIHGVQNFIALGGKPVTSQIAQKTNLDLVQVAAGSCEGLGDIDKRGQNGSQDPAKVPTDAFNDFGMVKSAGLTPAPPGDIKFGDTISAADRDALHINLDGLIDGPITLANVWSVSTTYRATSGSSVKKNEVIAIRTTAGQVIKTPGSGRMILDGSNLSGMVMYVSNDGVRFANSRNDKPTAQEGYNLYVWGITPDPGLASRYQCANETQGRQKMPEMHVGDPLGTAKSDFIYLALRDNGAFQDLLDTSWWNGKGEAGKNDPLREVTPNPLVGKLELDKACTSNNDCISGNCSPPGPNQRICIRGLLTTGDKCTHSSQCALTTCVAASVDSADMVCGVANTNATPAAPTKPAAPTATATPPVGATQKEYTLRVQMRSEADCLTVGTQAFRIYPYCHLLEVTKHPDQYIIKPCAGPNCYSAKLSDAGVGATGTQTWNFTFTVDVPPSVNVSTFTGYIVWDKSNNEIINFIYSALTNNLPNVPLLDIFGGNNKIIEFITPKSQR